MEWQLNLFKKSLKKKLKLKNILKFSGDFTDLKCLEVGCTTGVLSYFLSERGGKWIHTDKERSLLIETQRLVKNPLVQIDERYLPFREKTFDLIFVPDFLEHTIYDKELIKEIKRIIKEKGRSIITVPLKKKFSIINLLKRMFGLKDEIYGHVRAGYSLKELKKILQDYGIKVERYSTYSKFFTEFIELILNFFYVRFGTKKISTHKGKISPLSSSELRFNKTYFIYKFIYPFFKAFSFLDYFVFFTRGYVIVIEANLSN
ncbi:MAG: class I SAM-dependent methyltransferase [Acidobacteriota bacterium]